MESGLRIKLAVAETLKEMALSDRDPAIRLTAIRHLEQKAAKDSIPAKVALNYLISEGDQEVKVAAAEALRRVA